MRLQLTVVSESGMLLRHVREFAEGLGWKLTSDAPSAINLVEPDAGRDPDHLLNLLTYVSLTAAQAGVQTSEPLCRIQYREGPASQVTLGIRIAEFDLKA